MGHIVSKDGQKCEEKNVSSKAKTTKTNNDY